MLIVLDGNSKHHFYIKTNVDILQAESQTEDWEEFSCLRWVIWLHSQNTWQVHIYISLPLIVATVYWVLTCARHSSLGTSGFPFGPHSPLLLTPFCRWGDWEPGRSWNPFKDWQLLSGEAGIGTQVCLTKLFPKVLLGKSMKIWATSWQHPGAGWWDALRKRKALLKLANP